MTQMHWQVVSRTYPMGRNAGQPVVEFEFGNGVSIHYDPEVGGMTIYLPVAEALLSSLRTTETLRDDAVLVNVDRVQGALVGIEIVRSEENP
jgi:uncharacterized protein YuzE